MYTQGEKGWFEIKEELGNKERGGEGNWGYYEVTDKIKVWYMPWWNSAISKLMCSKTRNI